METNLIPASEMKTIFPGTTDQYWAALRHKGTGPNYVKLLRKVYYDRVDIEAWIEGNRFTRTDRPVNA
ncbi:MAG TPA: DNA-binding protein [Mycobacterium sp.]|nr:DNA-binding protein [Mycobacterium sp.]